MAASKPIARLLAALAVLLGGVFATGPVRAATLPAATKDCSPTRIPGRTVTFAPRKQPLSMTTGAAMGGKAACSGWSW